MESLTFVYINTFSLTYFDIFEKPIFVLLRCIRAVSDRQYIYDELIINISTQTSCITFNLFNTFKQSRPAPLLFSRC